LRSQEPCLLEAKPLVQADDGGLSVQVDAGDIFGQQHGGEALHGAAPDAHPLPRRIDLRSVS